MKKYWPLLVAPILSFAYTQQAPAPQIRPPAKEISVEAQPWVNNGVAEPFLEVDFIYWKVREDGLEYAEDGLGSPVDPVTSRGKVYEPDFDGEPGFRAALGVNMAHDGWDILLRYTWIYTHVTDSKSVNPNTDRLEPIWVHGNFSFLAGGLERARADWDLHTNVLDLEWGRNYYISPFLTLRPFFGLKGYWLNQDYGLSYTGFFDQAQTITGNNRVHLDQDTWGIGIRFGTNTAWYFARDWSVFADLALCAAWSKFDMERRDRGTNDLTNTTVTLAHLNYDRYSMVPIMELGVGLRWEMWFNQDSYHALIQAGWEEQIWWNFNRFFHVFSPFSTMGNLMYQGLTLKFRFDF
ncbi:MAG: MOMP family protein [Chlamydiia bacterium]|nr:MOMP family protein [Chlamydiia bacterium]